MLPYLAGPVGTASNLLLTFLSSSVLSPILRQLNALGMCLPTSLSGRQKWGLILPSSARVSRLTYQTVIAVRYPEPVTETNGVYEYEHFLGDGKWPKEDFTQFFGMPLWPYWCLRGIAGLHLQRVDKCQCFTALAAPFSSSSGPGLVQVWLLHKLKDLKESNALQSSHKAFCG